MKKIKIYLGLAMLSLASLLLTSCGSGSESSRESSSEDYEYADDSQASEGVVFRSTYDVYRYLNGKTFSGGLSIRFYNNGRSVDVNGQNHSNDVQIYDIGVNNNGVAYATVQMATPAGVTTTLTLLAVKNHAQLIDPNDGSIYEY